jgi:hypothetical protein
MPVHDHDADHTANRDGGTLGFTAEAWEAFAASLKQ